MSAVPDLLTLIGAVWIAVNGQRRAAARARARRSRRHGDGHRALALERGHLPGTTNLANLDPACDLDVLPACDLDILPPGGRDVAARYLVKNSFGFGGINTCLVLGAAARS